MFYTPHIDELYIGFECEILEDGTWYPCTIQSIERDQDISVFRVKYLNADDIIDEGFDFLSESKECKNFRILQYEQGQPIMVDLELYQTGILPLITIIKNRTVVISDLMIKNKNELRWLLNRVL